MFPQWLTAVIKGSFAVIFYHALCHPVIQDLSSAGIWKGKIKPVLITGLLLQSLWDTSAHCDMGRLQNPPLPLQKKQARQQEATSIRDALSPWIEVAEVPFRRQKDSTDSKIF